MEFGGDCSLFYCYMLLLLLFVLLCFLCFESEDDVLKTSLLRLLSLFGTYCFFSVLEGCFCLVFKTRMLFYFPVNTCVILFSCKHVCYLFVL